MKKYDKDQILKLKPFEVYGFEASLLFEQTKRPNHPEPNLIVKNKKSVIFFFIIERNTVIKLFDISLVGVKLFFKLLVAHKFRR